MSNNNSNLKVTANVVIKGFQPYIIGLKANERWRKLLVYNKMMIKFLDLQKINLVHQQEIEERLISTYRSGWYLLGNEVKKFEDNLARYVGSQYAIGVANGLDALRLILRAYIELGIFQKEMRLSYQLILI